MNFIDFLNDDRFIVNDPVSIIINKKTIVSLNDEINKKIKEIENIGINIGEEIKKIESINNSSQYEENFNVLVVLRNYKNKLEVFLREFNKQYFNFLTFYNAFLKLKNDLFTIFNIEKIDEHVEFIITSLENLKEKKEFQSENYTDFIYRIYEICYLYIKYELMFSKESKLYDYMISNSHDLWYINKFISNSIEELISSINYINVLDKLKTLTQNIENSNYINKDIILSICECEHNEDYIKSCIMKIKDYYGVFCVADIRIQVYFGTKLKIYTLNLMVELEKKEIKSSYLYLLNKYEEFISKVGYLKELEEYIIKIDEIKLEISSYLNLNEEDLKRINKLIHQKRKVRIL